MNEVIAHLAETGSFVWRDFASPALVRELREDLQRRRAAGEFHAAGVGPHDRVRTESSYRRDEIRWLEPGQGSAELWDRLEKLREALNRELFLGLVAFEGHYAAYPAGGFYRRHRDSFLTDHDRVVSVILYLNESWEEADGGRLRLYGAEGRASMDVDPRGGTLVGLLSREVEHEVLLSQCERLSFTGWFKVRALSGAH